jgi:hypothetical protein
MGIGLVGLGLRTETPSAPNGRNRLKRYRRTNSSEVREWLLTRDILFEKTWTRQEWWNRRRRFLIVVGTRILPRCRPVITVLMNLPGCSQTIEPFCSTCYDPKLEVTLAEVYHRRLRRCPNVECAISWKSRRAEFPISIERSADTQHPAPNRYSLSE